jgi:hypothetical protein
MSRKDKGKRLDARFDPYIASKEQMFGFLLNAHYIWDIMDA